MKQASRLLEAEIPSLDFAEVGNPLLGDLVKCQITVSLTLLLLQIFKLLPEDWSLTAGVVDFLYRAVDCTAARLSTSSLEVGLTSRLAAVSRQEASMTTTATSGLRVTGESTCAQCQRPLLAYGPARPFAWLLDAPGERVVHLHCLPPDSNL